MTAAPALRPAGALTFRCLSRLLTYPQEDLRAAVPRIARVLDVEGLLGEAAKAGVNRLLTDLATADLLDLQERYVELFDRQRSLSLHLFEHVYADSRDRGPAMVELKRAGAPFAGEIIFQAVADEETGSEWGTLHLIEQGYCEGASFAICTEPTSNRIELGNRGLRWMDVLVTGRASHAGRPWLGANAISAAAAIIAELDKLEFTRRDERFEIPEPSISVTTIQGGHTINIIPDSCSFTIDRRMLPGETENDVVLETQMAIDRALQGRPDIQVDGAVRPGCWDPYVIEPSEPVVQAALVAVRAILGREPQIGYKAACTDASHLVTRAGIPTLLLGPGNEQLSHKPDERIAVDSLIEGTAIYAELIRRLLPLGD